MQKNTLRRDFKGPGAKPNTWQPEKEKYIPREATYVAAEEKRNVDFEEYYTTQGICPEGEWETFMESLRRPLPVTFRINGSGRHADHVRDKLQSDFFSHFSDFDCEGMSGVSVQACCFVRKSAELSYTTIEASKGSVQPSILP